MEYVIREKIKLLNELYDATYVLKQGIETQNEEQILEMVEEREQLILEIEALKAPSFTESDYKEEYHEMKEILLKIKALDDFNLEHMPMILESIEEQINEGNRKKLEIDRAKNAYDKYQGASGYQGGNTFDIKK